MRFGQYLAPPRFVAVLTGVRSRIGSIRLGDRSGAAAALELREAPEI
jgi:hypothetical protein